MPTDIRLTTPEEAAALAAAGAPFRANPGGAVADAVQNAADSHQAGRPYRAAWWARVAALLVDAAANSYVRRGAVLTDLAATYRIDALDFPARLAGLATADSRLGGSSGAAGQWPW